MKTIVATFKVSSGNEKNFEDLAKQLHNKTVKESGNKAYIFCKNPDTANEYAFLEFWQDQEAIELHNTSEHFMSIIPKMVSLCSEDPEITVYDAFDF